MTTGTRTSQCRTIATLFAGVLFAAAPLVYPSTPEAAPNGSATASALAGDPIAERLPRIEYRGGPFVRHPRIVTITFAGDEPALVERLATFGDTITRTPWWRTVSAGYCARAGDCIGDGRPGTSVQLDDVLSADAHIADVAALLERHARAGTLGALDADTLLLVYTPATVRLRDAFVPQYCAGGRRAVHRALRFDGRTIPYAVLPRCGDEAALTASASHEILEATTNPDPARRGFAFEQRSENLGFTSAGIEPVDPCGIIARDRPRVMESGFTVQRAWSNAAAAAGNDPCVPSRSDEPYLALVPQHATVRLAKEGTSTTVALRADADRAVPAWSVSALDLTGVQEGKPCLDVKLDTATVTRGKAATLTITVRRRHPNALCVVGLVSSRAGSSHLWPLAVSTR